MVFVSAFAHCQLFVMQLTIWRSLIPYPGIQRCNCFQINISLFFTEEISGLNILMKKERKENHNKTYG